MDPPSVDSPRFACRPKRCSNSAGLPVGGMGYAPRQREPGCGCRSPVIVAGSKIGVSTDGEVLGVSPGNLFGSGGGAGGDDRGRYAVESYLDHHGDKLVERFDANSYLAVNEALISHDVARGRGQPLACACAQRL